MVTITDEEIKQAMENERKAKFDAWRNEYLRARAEQLVKERNARQPSIMGLDAIRGDDSAIMGLDMINKI